MATLETALDPRAPSFLENRSTALAALSLLDAAHAQARDGGGEREVTRHHARGKLLPRERIELLVDRDTALLELAATVGMSAGEAAGAGVVTAIGVVERTECVIIANDPTVRPSGLSEHGRRKVARAVELGRQFELPLIQLWESSAEAREAGIQETRARDVAASSPVPVITAVFGMYEGPVSLADHYVAVRGHGDVDSADTAADDERDALRIIRQIVCRLARRPVTPLAKALQPRYESEDLLAVNRSEVREVLARVLDGSDFEEVRSHRGGAAVAGFGTVHGRSVAILGNTGSVLDSDAVGKGLELVRLATMTGVPVVVLANPVVPVRESGLATPNGDGPQVAHAAGSSGELARALAGSYQVTFLLGAHAPDWALVSRGFRFAWPASAESDEPYDGMIDPRDTRTVLGICLSVMGGSR